MPVESLLTQSSIFVIISELLISHSINTESSTTDRSAGLEMVTNMFWRSSSESFEKLQDRSTIRIGIIRIDCLIEKFTENIYER